MNPRRLALVIAGLVFFALAAIPASAETIGRRDTPSSVTQAFYAHHFAHDMAFTADSVRAKSKWLAPDVLEACLAYLARPQSPDEVPAIDGDPFTNSQEYPKRFRLGEPVVTEGTARVPVTLRWRHDRKSIHAVLTLVDGSWKIKDVEYDEGGGSLAALLKSP